jgi:hypothetical protein
MPAPVDRSGMLRNAQKQLIIGGILGLLAVLHALLQMLLK